MAWLADFFNSFMHDISAFFTSLATWAIAHLIVSYIEFKIFLIKFAWGVAQQVLISLDFASLINKAFSNFSPEVQSRLAFLGVPEGLTLIAQTWVARFTLGYLGAL